MLLQLIQHFVFFFLHVGETGSFRKPLSKQQEMNCFLAMAAGDKQAREKLILHNMRLVAHLTKKYGVSISKQEELISIGTIGLMKAVDTFDPSKGTRFATYAGRYIENEILMNFRSQKKYADQISMGESIETDEDGNQLTLMDIMEDGTDLVELVDTRMQSKQLYQFLGEILELREVEILVQRYGLYSGVPLTQREVAKKMGISRSYVSRLEKHAIEKLRKQYNIV
ncbi:MAG: RNA polymerase sporulation sigma factor SigK [Ruminococcus sp.]|nr:RNA polymerase sporulation sigma factor SigK [Ruminococcus sp.]